MSSLVIMHIAMQIWGVAQCCTACGREASGAIAHAHLDGPSAQHSRSAVMMYARVQAMTWMSCTPPLLRPAQQWPPTPTMAWMGSDMTLLSSE